MRRAAELTHETVELPPFALFFDPHDPLRFFNYARPIEPIGQAASNLRQAQSSGRGASTGIGCDLSAALVALRQAFEARNRLPRLEFVPEYAPGLPAALKAAGFVEEGRNPLLVCTAETFRPAPVVPGLEIVTLTADSPLDALCAAAAAGRSSPPVPRK
ncbi:MAG: hypothetical protein FJ011_14650 [Chloroflexi bacterium]|nr:hypothetical protein [Chloroflexota bacterium]